MYFDNAATTFPKPEPVYRAMDEFMRARAANPGRSGHRLAIEADIAIARARQALARLLGVPDAQRLVWTANGTEAINLAIKGLARPGDRVVTTSLEHNAAARPLRALERRGVCLVRVPCPGGEFDAPAFCREITRETRLVVMLHASNVAGTVLPVREMGEVCGKLGVPLMVDAAQSAGTLTVDVGELSGGAPERLMIAMPGHKGLLGPPGTGALYVGAALDLEPLREGGTGSQSESDVQPESYPDRMESGTLNTVGIAGLGAAVEWILETGRERIRAHEAALVAQLWAGLEELAGVTLYGPPPGPERAGIVSFNLEGWEPSDVAQALDGSFDVQCRPGLHCAPWAHHSLGTFPAGTVRLSPGFFNTEAEVEAVLAAVRALLGA